MIDDTYLRAYQLFQASLSVAEGERAAFIAGGASLEPHIAAAAARMLEAFGKCEESEPGAAVELPEWAHDREGSILKGWYIEKHLSLGGYGRVYRARRRTQGSSEEAAIKFLDISPGAVPRFLRERQTLADLDHEGICKFIDGGTTAGGVPYLVMEYVAGLPITRFSDLHRLTITERLKLFVKLCHAAEYAHQHRVLHRDLKPANILVTAARAVRVLDLGVARMLDFGRADGERLTKTGETPWTRVYASPEQIQGGELSFATDVYSLGVVLYELLTGQLPISEFALRGGDWSRVISEREPLPPSEALLLTGTDPASGGSEHIPETAADLRGGSPSRLRHVLRGNLDAVILKALKKDPGQRYSRVDRLREDVESFLDGLPVSARRSRAWERVWNWCVRHPATAAATAAWTLIMLSVLNLTTCRGLQYAASVREERRALDRLEYVTGSALPNVERALPPNESGRKARLLTTEIHTRLLERIEAMPYFTRTKMERALASSALECAQQWIDLGNPHEALIVTAPIVPSVTRWNESNPFDRQWRELYLDLFRQRLTIHSQLHQDADAAEDARRLIAVKTGEE